MQTSTAACARGISVAPDAKSLENVADDCTKTSQLYTLIYRFSLKLMWYSYKAEKTPCKISSFLVIENILFFRKQNRGSSLETLILSINFSFFHIYPVKVPVFPSYSCFICAVINSKPINSVCNIAGFPKTSEWMSKLFLFSTTVKIIKNTLVQSSSANIAFVHILIAFNTCPSAHFSSLDCTWSRWLSS